MTRDEGLRLQQLFKSRGMTGREVAKAVGVTPSAISKWISGESGLTQKRYVKLANALGMSVDDLRKAIKGNLSGYEELIIKYKIENGNYIHYETVGRLVRCKDCEYWRGTDCGSDIIQSFGPDGYCSEGRRPTD